MSIAGIRRRGARRELPSQRVVIGVALSQRRRNLTRQARRAQEHPSEQTVLTPDSSPACPLCVLARPLRSPPPVKPSASHRLCNSHHHRQYRHSLSHTLQSECGSGSEALRRQPPTRLPHRLRRQRCVRSLPPLSCLSSPCSHSSGCAEAAHLEKALLTHHLARSAGPLVVLDNVKFPSYNEVSRRPRRSNDPVPHHLKRKKRS